MPKVEKLDIRNIIEIEKIRSLLVEHPAEASLLEIIIILCNEKINSDKDLKKQIINTDDDDDDDGDSDYEPELSDHSSDEDD